MSVKHAQYQPLQPRRSLSTLDVIVANCMVFANSITAILKLFNPLPTLRDFIYGKKKITLATLYRKYLQHCSAPVPQDAFEAQLNSLGINYDKKTKASSCTKKKTMFNSGRFRYQ